MSIPIQQLTSWSAYPNPSRSVSAHAAIKSALLSSGRFGHQTVEIYLQGSYRNYVNTRQDSDVDIVAELTSVCDHDLHRLHPWEQQRFWNATQYSDYTHERFRADVVTALTDRFHQAVVPHAKAIEVHANWRRLKVDVLPALRYRQIYAFDGVNVSSDDGIAFWTPDGRRVVNWPNQNFNNGVTKNDSTGGHFKPAVRIFKNARRAAVQRNLLSDGLAPSYFVQALLWNVPDELFGADLSQTYCGVVNWLAQSRWQYHLFRCQNGIEPIFGTSPEQWNLTSAYGVTDALSGLWDGWQ